MNKSILMGRLTRDPEVRYSSGDNPTAVARYTLVVDRRYQREGQTVYTTEVVVEKQEFAESKAASERSQQADSSNLMPSNAGDGFMNIPDGIDEDLPFN